MSHKQSAYQRWRFDYLSQPDYSKARLEIAPDLVERMRARLEILYSPADVQATLDEIVRLLRVHHAHKTPAILEAEREFDPAARFSERDLMLITYGDMIRASGKTGLEALSDFLQAFRIGEPLFSTLHVLPFFPYTSDRGFSIVDFKSVDPKLGTWANIQSLGKTHRLMFDGVLNHASSQSAAFQQMLAGSPDYRDFAFAFRSPDELTDEQKAVIRRPRTSELLTRFEGLNGPVWVWTTFSPDQIDLNYRNPKVLLSAIDTLLFYVRMGADYIRLDAVTYIWKELGTSSASLEETHTIVKLFRDVLNAGAPHVVLVTETNVPHKENISYFGNGEDEAQVVYNFALPPLVLHAFYRQDVSCLAKWASGLEYPSQATTYLNMLDSHDGIGLPGAQGILPRQEIEFLVAQARLHGAFVSNRSTASGEEPYEINATWYSALNQENSGESREFQIQRFIASRAIALALRGIPAVYLHSLAGTRNDIRLALSTKVKRDVNRSVLELSMLQRLLADPSSKLHLLSEQWRRILRTRVGHSAFHPNGSQRILMLHKGVFSVLREAPGSRFRVLCLINVTDSPQKISIPEKDLGVRSAIWTDLLGGHGWSVAGSRLKVTLAPYEVFWLAPFVELESLIEKSPSVQELR